MVAQFARHGAKFQGNDPEAANGIYQATLSRNPKLLKLMVRSPLIKHNETLTRSLAAAIAIDSVEQLETLLSQMNSPNLRLNPRTGETLLHSAAEKGAMRCLRALVAKGGDLSIGMVQGSTPFGIMPFWRVKQRSPRLSLKKLRSTLKKKFPDGNSYFHVASMQGNLPMLAFLATASPSQPDTVIALNTLDSSGNTPLHLAAKNGNRKSSQLLILLGVNHMVQNSEQKTAYDLAKDLALIPLMQRYSTTVDTEVKNGSGRIHAATLLEDLNGIAVLAKIEGIQMQDKRGRRPYTWQPKKIT